VFTFFVGNGVEVSESNSSPSYVCKQWNAIFNSKYIWQASPVTKADRKLNLSCLKKIDWKNKQCFKCIKRATGEVIFVRQKQMHRQIGIPYSSIRMITALKSISEHPSIVRLLDVNIWDDTRVFCVFEYFPHSLDLILRYECDDYEVTPSDLLLKEKLKRQQLEGYPHDDDGVYKYVSELREKSRKAMGGGLGFLAPWNVSGIMQQVMSGLYHLHAHRIIHRNVKPKHVLLRPGPNPLKVNQTHIYTSIRCHIKNK
jgi:serine/threonine protein kinase